MCFRAVKYLSPRQSYWLYLIHPLSCLPPNYIDYSSMSWLRSKMAAALLQWRCYSLIAIRDFSLCGALGLLCLWQMLSYVHELSYKPMMCFSPSSPLIWHLNWKFLFLGKKINEPFLVQEWSSFFQCDIKDNFHANVLINMLHIWTPGLSPTIAEDTKDSNWACERVAWYLGLVGSFLGRVWHLDFRPGALKVFLMRYTYAPRPLGM